METLTPLAVGFSLSYSPENATSCDQIACTRNFSQKITGISQGSLSKELFNAVLGVLTITHIVLGVAAFLTGIVNAAILSRNISAAFAYYLIGLSTADATVAFCAILYVAVVTANPLTSLAAQVIQTYFASFVSVAAQRAGVCLNALACVDRFLAIVLPFKASALRLTSRKALIAIIIMVFVSSVVGHLYMVIQYKVKLVSDNTYGLARTDIGRTYPEFFQAFSQVSSVMFLYAPLIIIFLLNVLMVIVLRVYAMQFNLRASRGQGGPAQQGKGQEARREPNSESQVTKMVLLLSFAVVFLQSPATINASVGTVLSDYGPLGKESNLYHILNYALFQVTLWNQPVVLLITLLHSRQFADAFRSLWCR